MKNTFYILIILILLTACEKPEKFHEIDGYGPVYMRYKPDTPLVRRWDAYNLYTVKTYGYHGVEIIDSQEEYEKKIVSKGYYFYPEVDFNKRMVYIKSGRNSTCEHKIVLKKNKTGINYKLDHYINYNKNPGNSLFHYYTINYTLPKINNKELIFENEMRLGSDDLFLDDEFLIGIYKGTYYNKSGDSLLNYTIEIKNTDIDDEYCINCYFNRDEGLYLIDNNDVYRLYGINTFNNNIYYHNTDELVFKYFAELNELEVFLIDGFFIGKKQ